MRRTFAAIIPAGVGTIASCFLVIASACGSDNRGPTTISGPSLLPTQTPLPPAPPPSGVPISVGEAVRDTLTGHGTERRYQLTAPTDGTLILRLSWEAGQGLLELRVGDQQFMASTPGWLPPIAARVSVAGGQTYAVRVMDGAPWDYDVLYLPFVLMTSME
jgi:hypothetical protein